MARILIASGEGRYADPWHPFAETSAAIAQIAAEHGHRVHVHEVEEALAEPGEADLLVANFGWPADRDDAAEAAIRAGVLAHLAAGGPLLVSHVSTTSLPRMPEWEAILGGIWVRGTTMHPEYGTAQVHVVGDSPLTAGIGDFALQDERYTFMRMADDVVPLLEHEHDGVRHPLLWERTFGPARIVVDLLGHDAASYASPEHREIVGRAIDRLTAGASAG